ncbi:MAG: hypothetical protein ABW120_05710 [Sedimenticola sp.]
MKTVIAGLMALALVVFGIGSATAAKGDKGHGAGGVAEEQASEMGLEKGKRYAGSKEKKSKEEGEEKLKKEKKEKKAKKEKKSKKGK